jgi:hypothetical protein
MYARINNPMINSFFFMCIVDCKSRYYLYEGLIFNMKRNTGKPDIGSIRSVVYSYILNP